KGDDELWASAKGYANNWLDDQAASLTFELEEGFVLAGHVRDDKGQPIPHVHLRPLLGDLPESSVALTRSKELASAGIQGSQSKTGADGSFRLERLPAGGLHLLVRPPKSPSFIESRVVAGEEGALILLPNEDEFGESRGLKLMVSIFDDSTFEPLDHATVSVFRLLDDGSGIPVADASQSTRLGGKAEFRLPDEGLFRLSAWAEGYSVTHVNERVFPTGTYHVQVPMSRNGDLQVLVVDPSGKAQPGVAVFATDAEGEPLRFQHASADQYSARPWLLSDERGRARANQMSLGVVTLTARRGPKDSPALATSSVLVESGQATEVTLTLDL
ncbi:MAG: carboxypeptidase-like regulatory domain-containing protein, partial [Planctomycetota bacterium]